MSRLAKFFALGVFTYACMLIATAAVVESEQAASDDEAGDEVAEIDHDGEVAKHRTKRRGRAPNTCNPTCQKNRILAVKPCPTTLFCWTCDASSEAECLETGSYQACPSTSNRCKAELFTDGSVKRYCAGSQLCSLNALQTQDCSGNKCEKCKFESTGGSCPVDNYACNVNSPPNPCAQSGALHCWHCKHAKDQAQCLLQGQSKKCKQADPICITKTFLGSDGEERMTTGCAARNDPACNRAEASGQYCCGEDCQRCHFDESIYSCNPAAQRCYCRGDPHCTTFDGKSLVFSSNCEHRLARDGCSNGMPIAGSFESFVVDVETNHLPGSTTKSYVTSVTVDITSRGLVCRLLQNRVVDCGNGDLDLTNPVFPLNGVPDFMISEVNGLVMFRGYLAPGRGFEVRWDGEHFVAVDVTASMKGEMCGLCMDYDDTTSDEFVLGPHASCLGLTTGAMTQDTHAFVKSWGAQISCVCPAFRNLRLPGITPQ